MMYKRGISPLVSTLLLVAFALVVGAITMTWGKAYVENIQTEPKKDLGAFTTAVIIDLNQIDDALKNLQVYYLTGKITKEDYLQRETALLEVERTSGPNTCTSQGICITGFSCWYKIPAATFQGIAGTSVNPGKCYSDASLAKLK